MRSDSGSGLAGLYRKVDTQSPRYIMTERNISGACLLIKFIFMRLGFLRVKGEEFGSRVDVDSEKERGKFLEYDAYDKNETYQGTKRVPADNIIALDIPKVVDEQ